MQPATKQPLCLASEPRRGSKAIGGGESGVPGHSISKVRLTPELDMLRYPPAINCLLLTAGRILIKSGPIEYLSYQIAPDVFK